MNATTSCPFCGERVAVLADDIALPEPVTDDEWDTALELVTTVHQIQAHLDDIEPEPAA